MDSRLRGNDRQIFNSLLAAKRHEPALPSAAIPELG